MARNPANMNSVDRMAHEQEQESTKRQLEEKKKKFLSEATTAGFTPKQAQFLLSKHLEVAGWVAATRDQVI